MKGIKKVEFEKIKQWYQNDQQILLEIIQKKSFDYNENELIIVLSHYNERFKNKTRTEQKTFALLQLMYLHNYWMWHFGGELHLDCTDIDDEEIMVLNNRAEGFLHSRGWSNMFLDEKGDYCILDIDDFVLMFNRAEIYSIRTNVDLKEIGAKKYKL